MKAAAKALAADLAAVDPAHQADYEQGRGAVRSIRSKPLDAKIAEMRKKYAGQPVIASEPVFGYQAGLIGLKVHNEKFALAVMNNAEPTASEVAASKTTSRATRSRRCSTTRRPANRRCSGWCRWPRTTRYPSSASPKPSRPATTYQTWMLGQLDALDAALAGAAK